MLPRKKKIQWRQDGKRLVDGKQSGNLLLIKCINFFSESNIKIRNSLNKKSCESKKTMKLLICSKFWKAIKLCIEKEENNYIKIFNKIVLKAYETYSIERIYYVFNYLMYYIIIKHLFIYLQES